MQQRLQLRHVLAKVQHSPGSAGVHVDGILQFGLQSQSGRTVEHNVGLVDQQLTLIVRYPKAFAKCIGKCALALQ